MEKCANPIPMSDAIGFDNDGTPHLVGQRCSHCGKVMPGRRLACANCFRADGLESADLGTDGMIFAWTIVHRSFPGVPVPIISAAVRLSSGAHVLGNVEGLSPDPKAVADCPGVQVDFATLDAPDGSKLIRYFFKPLTGDAA